MIRVKWCWKNSGSCESSLKSTSVSWVEFRVDVKSHSGTRSVVSHPNWHFQTQTMFNACSRASCWCLGNCSVSRLESSDWDFISLSCLELKTCLTHCVLLHHQSSLSYFLISLWFYFTFSDLWESELNTAQYLTLLNLCSGAVGKIWDSEILYLLANENHTEIWERHFIILYTMR